MADTGAFGPLSNASSPTDDIAKATFIDHFIYAGLYRRDALQRPMPDLATSCTPDAAGTMITCTLGAATFHNGQPVTADDVAFTYRLANANTGVDSEFGRPCIEMLLPIASACLFEILEAVEKVVAERADACGGRVAAQLFEGVEDRKPGAEHRGEL